MALDTGGFRPDRERTEWVRTNPICPVIAPEKDGHAFGDRTILADLQTGLLTPPTNGGTSVRMPADLKAALCDEIR